ncbi:MAG TPA: c-type cytochrome [Gammaproteobacteria bacterium]|nr:c-type cytochrome [Gammaproteobacteria bacterium]
MFQIKSRRQGQGYWFVLALFILVASSQPVGASHSHQGRIEVIVNASLGGTFTDDVNNPTITITIPPGALSRDAKLKVRQLREPGKLGPNQTAASPAFRVKLKKVDDDDDDGDGEERRDDDEHELTLNKPMLVEIAATQVPVHPQIGEIAIRRQGKWNRMMANFYKASTNSVVTRTKNTKGKYRVAHRTLQARNATDPDVVRGRDLYFNDDWGSHEYWTNTFQLHEVLNNVDPATAASLGVQIDLTKVPQFIVDVMLSDDFAAKQAALTDPATTIALLQADAVLGLKAQFNDVSKPNRVTSVGLTCALCHVTVTPTAFQIAPPPADPTPLPIGIPVIGPPNAGIQLGKILSFTPLVQAGSEHVNIEQYQSWGPGAFDPRFLPNNPIDDGVNNPSQIPQHWNYMDLAEQDYDITWIGILHTTVDNESMASGPECGIDLPLGTNGAWGTPGAVIKNFEFGNTLPQWVFDALDVAETVEPGIGTEPGVTQEVTRSKLLDLKAFLESIVSPAPLAFDEARAEAGWELFYGKANCVACHASAEGTRGKSARGDITKNKGIYFTNIVENKPQGLLGLGIKVPGLRGLAFTAPYFHDGSAATLDDVVKRYTSTDIPEVPSTLTAEEQSSIVEYLKSL